MKKKVVTWMKNNPMKSIGIGLVLGLLVVTTVYRLVNDLPLVG